MRRSSNGDLVPTPRAAGFSLAEVVWALGAAQTGVGVRVVAALDATLRYQAGDYPKNGKRLLAQRMSSPSVRALSHRGDTA